MVCAVEAVPYEKIKAQFKEGERISIVTCNTCTRSQDAGGAKLMEEIAGLLVKDVGVDRNDALPFRKASKEVDSGPMSSIVQSLGLGLR